MKRRDVQDGRACVLQRAGADAVFAHGQQLTDRAVGRVDLPDLFIAGVFQPIYALPAQQLHDQTVEIFRAGADDDASGWASIPR